MPYSGYQLSPRTNGVACQHPSVLIVEDEPLIALAMEEGFAALRFDVAGVFASCMEALMWIDAHHPDVAVLDTMLRDGPCYPLALELKRRGVPFLICSGLRRDQNEPPELADVLRISKPPPFDLLVLATQALVFAPIIPAMTLANVELPGRGPTLPSVAIGARLIN